MGAWHFVRERFLDGEVGGGERVPRYVGRAESAASATGQLRVHLMEQEALVAEALRLGADLGASLKGSANAVQTG